MDSLVRNRRVPSEPEDTDYAERISIQPGISLSDPTTHWRRIDFHFPFVSREASKGRSFLFCKVFDDRTRTFS